MEVSEDNWVPDWWEPPTLCRVAVLTPLEDMTVATEGDSAEMLGGCEDGIPSSTTSPAVGSSMVVNICWNPDIIVWTVPDANEPRSA